MMSEFSFDRASDWDLQAIVKGRATASNTMNVHGVNIPPSYAWFDSLGLEDYQANHEHSAFILDKVEPQNQGVATQKIVDSSLIHFDKYTKSSRNEDQGKATTNASYANNSATTKSRRRKNKHKVMKVVEQAGEDHVVSDEWNWRKYGEKAIKGSPYPRSYYRCSHPGGCLARKQVEQSCNDQGLFLITYMEEHSHPYPIRRHSQAGRSARKLSHPSQKALTTTNESQSINLVRNEASLESPTELDDQLLVFRGDENDERCAKFVEDEDVSVRNSVCEDDFFAGLDYLEGLSKDFDDL